MSHLDIMIERLDRIDWVHEDPMHRGSNLRLLRESAVRFARWSKLVEIPPEGCLAVFFDLAEALVPYQPTPFYPLDKVKFFSPKI